VVFTYLTSNWQSCRCPTSFRTMFGSPSMARITLVIRDNPWNYFPTISSCVITAQYIGLPTLDVQTDRRVRRHTIPMPRLRMETPAVRRATARQSRGPWQSRLPCTASEQHLRWPFLRCRRPAHMERAPPVQPTRHWAIADYFQRYQRTSKNVYLFSIAFWDHGARRICDIYDLFAPCIILHTYLRTYVLCAVKADLRDRERERDNGYQSYGFVWATESLAKSAGYRIGYTDMPKSKVHE